MIRTLLVAAALTVAAPAAFAQDFTSDDYANGVTVQGQLPDSYIIRIDTRGKDERSIRAEIWDAAWTACQRAPSSRLISVASIPASGPRPMRRPRSCAGMTLVSLTTS